MRNFGSTRRSLLPRRTQAESPDRPLEEFLKSLNSIVGLDQLLDSLSAKLYELLDAGTITIVLFESITNRYAGKKSKGDHPEYLDLFTLSPSDRLVKWLNINRVPLEVQHQPEVIRYLSPSEQDLLRRTGTVLVAPLIVLNRLIGALFTSGRIDGAPYSGEDMQTLGMLTAQSALAIEHAMMYQFQEDKLKKLFHADKLATVGELAAGAAHEIRNPLTSIRSTIQYLKKDLPEGKKQLADGVIDEVDRIDRIIRGLLSFSKTSDLRLATVAVEEILDQTLLLLDPELRKYSVGVSRRFSCPPGHWISADAAQLKQVFLNILLNSIQAMPGGGTITLTVAGAAPVRASGGGGGESGGNGEQVRIEIQDTGSGIPEEELARVFDPFYTTKTDGTGLGLSISYGIVSKHGGEIELSSTAAGATTGAAKGAGSGTRVVIRLPGISAPAGGPAQ